MKELKKWRRERKIFLIKMTLIAFIFYISLPLSIGLFPDFMSKPRIDWISFAWIYSFLQVFMTWLFGWIYWLKAKKLDELLIEVEHEAGAAE